MSLKINIATSDGDKSICDQIVIDNHSYVASAKTVGRVIKYIIHYENDVVGTFWLGSGFKPTPKSILDYFNKSQSQFDEMFNAVADNKRFCLIKSIPNLGSQILKGIRNRARQDVRVMYRGPRTSYSYATLKKDAHSFDVYCTPR